MAIDPADQLPDEGSRLPWFVAVSAVCRVSAGIKPADQIGAPGVAQGLVDADRVADRRPLSPCFHGKAANKGKAPTGFDVMRQICPSSIFKRHPRPIDQACFCRAWHWPERLCKRLGVSRGSARQGSRDCHRIRGHGPQGSAGTRFATDLSGGHTAQTSARCARSSSRIASVSRRP